MRLALLLLLVLSSSASFAHAYFFGFAEMAYSTTENRYETTLIVSTHDIEEWFQHKGLAVKELEDHVGDQNLLTEMAKTLLTGFSVNADGKSLSFSCIGYEILENGLTHFYFQSNKCQKASAFSIRYDLMMDFLPEQQNKLTLLDGEKSYTSTFTQTQKQNTISTK